jgi:hypothetical protein
MTRPTSRPTNPPPPKSEPSPVQEAFSRAREQFASLSSKVRHKYGVNARREHRLELFDFVIAPMMADYAESYTRTVVGEVEKKAEQALHEATQLGSRVKYFDEFVCPTCKEPRHPKSAVCWKCAHEGMRKSYSANAEAYAKLQSYLRTQRTVLKLAVNALSRSARQKKKGPFVRQACALLEAALAEPEPEDLSMSLLMKLGIGAVGIFGAMAAYWGVSAYARPKVGAWGSTADAGPPPTAEELAASP